jgi:transposase
MPAPQPRKCLVIRETTCAPPWQTDGRLTFFYLPTYAPELNPDELVWKNVKHDNIGKASIRNAYELRSRATSALQYLHDTPELIKAIFRTPRLAYIHA